MKDAESLDVLEASLAARARTKAQRDSGTKVPVYEEVVVPEQLGPVEVLVDDAQVKEFAFTQDDYGEWYFDDSPFGGRIGHAAILGNHLLNVYYTAYDRHRVVGLHTEESLSFHSPIAVGETATLRGAYVDKYERKRRGYVVMEAEARGEDDRLLVRHRGIEIMRIDPGTVVEEPAAVSRDAGASSEGHIDGSCDESQPLAAAAAPGLAPRTPIRPIPKLVTSARMSVFSFIGEFQRNIHSDLEVAQGGGIELPICQGQQQACFLAELATSFFGAAWFTSGRLRVKFIQPLYANSAVLLGGRVARCEQTPEGERLHLELWIDRGGGVLTAVGWASALLGDPVAATGSEAR